MTRERDAARLWRPETVDPERALELADPACWTCWSYRCMTSGRLRACPWCTGLRPAPIARPSRYADVTSATESQVRASRSRRGRSAAARKKVAAEARPRRPIDREARAKFTGTSREYQKRSRAYDPPPPDATTPRSGSK